MDAFTRFLYDVQDEQPATTPVAEGLANMDWGQLQQVDHAVSNVDPTKISHVVPVAPQAHLEHQQPYGLTDAEAAIMNKVAGVERAARSMAQTDMEKEARSISAQEAKAFEAKVLGEREAAKVKRQPITHLKPGEGGRYKKLSPVQVAARKLSPKAEARLEAMAAPKTDAPKVGSGIVRTHATSTTAQPKAETGTLKKALEKKKAAPPTAQALESVTKEPANIAPKKTYPASPVIIGEKKAPAKGLQPSKIVTPGPKPMPVGTRPNIIDPSAAKPKPGAKIEVVRASSKKQVSGGKLNPQLQASAAKTEARAAASKIAPEWVRSGGESTVGQNPRRSNLPTDNKPPTAKALESVTKEPANIAPKKTPTVSTTPKRTPTVSTTPKKPPTKEVAKSTGRMAEFWGKHFKGRTGRKVGLGLGGAALLAGGAYGASKLFGGKKKAASVDEDALELAIRQKVESIDWDF